MSSDSIGHTVAFLDDAAKKNLQQEKDPKPQMSGMHLGIVMFGLLCLGSINFVMLKVMYTAYGDRYAFFVNQGVSWGLLQGRPG